MKNGSLIFSILATFILFPSQAIAFSRIYGFGDSLLDTGNVNEVVLQATGGTQTFPPSPPYDTGRFSNGKIWVELLAERLDIPLVSFAFGGATTGVQNTLDATLPGIPLPGLQQQIANFAANNPIADSEALYTIWAGANDYAPTNSIGFSPYDTPTIPLTNIQTAVNTLIGVGAKQIMVVNLPNLGEIPITSASLDGNCPVDNQFDADCLNDLTMAHNQGLSSLLASVPSDVNIIPLDVNSLVKNAIQNPAQFGFTNVTDACLDFSTFIPCSNPDGFLFWDNRHPSARGHRFVGELALKKLGIPEPNANAGLAAIGLMVAGAALRKKVLRNKRMV